MTHPESLIFDSLWWVTLDKMILLEEFRLAGGKVGFRVDHRFFGTGLSKITLKYRYLHQSQSMKGHYNVPISY